MAERKSDFTGDEFGDWTVQGRVEKRQEWMAKGKRYWEVLNNVTAELRIVEQTALKDLPKEDAVAPVKLVSVGSNLQPTWADIIPVIECEDCEEPEDYHIGEAPELYADAIEMPGIVAAPRDPVMVEHLEAVMNDLGQRVRGQDNPIYVPRGPLAESAQIARAAMGQAEPVVAHWAAALPVADVLAVDPAEAEVWAGQEGDPFEGIPSGPLLPTPQWTLQEGQVEKFGGIGEAAETSVSEAELDERVPAPDPVRTLIRKLMGDVAELRSDMTGLLGTIEVLVDTVDQLLKAHITR